MAASASAATEVDDTTAPAAASGIAGRCCLAHSSWQQKGGKNKACKFCGVKKKKHTEPFLVPEAAAPEIAEVSKSCEDPSSL